MSSLHRAAVTVVIHMFHDMNFNHRFRLAAEHDLVGGATAVAVAWPSLRWLDFHRGLRVHLDRYPTVVDNSRLVLYRLDDG